MKAQFLPLCSTERSLFCQEEELAISLFDPYISRAFILVLFASEHRYWPGKHSKQVPYYLVGLKKMVGAMIIGVFL